MVGCRATYNHKSKFVGRAKYEQSKIKNYCFDFNENIPVLNTTSCLGYVSKECKMFFTKLNKISEEMDKGNEVELDVEALLKKQGV